MMNHEIAHTLWLLADTEDLTEKRRRDLRRAAREIHARPQQVADLGRLPSWAGVGAAHPYVARMLAGELEVVTGQWQPPQRTSAFAQGAVVVSAEKVRRTHRAPRSYGQWREMQDDAVLAQATAAGE